MACVPSGTRPSRPGVPVDEQDKPDSEAPSRRTRPGGPAPGRRLRRARRPLTGWRRVAAMAMVVVVLLLSVVVMIGPRLSGGHLLVMDSILAIAAVVMVVLVRAGR